MDVEQVGCVADVLQDLGRKLFDMNEAELAAAMKMVAITVVVLELTVADDRRV